MRKLSFSDLEKDPFYQKVIKLVKEQYGASLPEYVKRAMLDSAEWSGVTPRQKENWVHNTKLIVQAICSGRANKSDFALFWIRFWAIISDYYTEVEIQRVFYAAIPLYKPILTALETLRNKFSEEELIFIRYIRDCNTHLHQDRVRGKAKIKNSVMIGFKPTKDPRVLEVAEKILSANNMDDRNVAREYAGRIKNDIESLVAAVSKWVNAV